MEVLQDVAEVGQMEVLRAAASPMGEHLLGQSLGPRSTALATNACMIRLIMTNFETTNV